ncbi:hypothetical protein CDCA_CDCA05G1509 [Cyanidium caldarium]|uniref:Uncharacterized protein n=1 Tax=Cyanidium caldarium TaxID=2771 RepID=A0AAV9IT66_CYACA|nr:hypothetical protein CDCA_CDCA05G1509 [Cyanidium caldarium]
MNGVTLQLRQRGNKSGREDDAEPSWVQQRDESARGVLTPGVPLSPRQKGLQAYCQCTDRASVLYLGFIVGLGLVVLPLLLSFLMEKWWMG